MSTKRALDDTDNVRVLKQRIKVLKNKVAKLESEINQRECYGDGNEARTVYLIKGDVEKFRKEFKGKHWFDSWDQREVKHGDTTVTKVEFWSASIDVFEFIREHFQTDESVKRVDFELELY